MELNPSGRGASGIVLSVRLMEPGTFGLLGIGVTALLGLRRSTPRLKKQ